MLITLQKLKRQGVKILMSKYTTELRFICEEKSGLRKSEGAYSITNIIKNARPNIFNFKYPIFDPEYKPVLETKILRHFYLNEIATETYGQWHMFLETKMNEIMPYYNEFYKTLALNVNPLYNVLIETKRNNNEKRKENNNGGEKTKINEKYTGDSNSKIKNYNLFSDTPQGSLRGVENENYLTDARKITGEDKTITKDGKTGENSRETTENNNATTETEYIEKISGKNGGESFAETVMKYRESFINVDMMVIDDLKDLFFLLW